MFEMLAGAIDGSGWVDPASVVSLHPTKSSEFGISKSNKDKFIIRSRFGEVGRMVDNSVRSVIDFASENVRSSHKVPGLN